jgi:uncharacterized membrane protein
LSVLKHKQTHGSKNSYKETKVLFFRWNYIILPVVILIISVITAAYFYRLLPAETAYRFSSDGTPVRWLGRTTIVAWFLLFQLLLTLLSGGITWGTTKLNTLFKQLDTTNIKLESILTLMGNMIALPQIIIFFTMLDIFSYNSYQRHLIPIWMLALLILGIGGIILGIFFFRAVSQIRRANQ